MNKKYIEKDIYTYLIKSEANKPLKKFLNNYLYNPDYKKVLFAVSYGLLGLQFLKYKWNIIEEKISWNELKKFELCKKDTENKIDAIDYMTHGTRTIEDCYIFLKKNGFTKSKNQVVDEFLKERLKYKYSMPSHIMVVQDNKKKWWVIDGNHRMFWYMKRKIENKKQRDLICIYLYKKQKVK